MKTNNLTRRHFLALASKGIGAAIVSQGVLGSGVVNAALSANKASVPVEFNHGVASGDPTQNAVILWTRVSPVNAKITTDIPVSWEVATDPDFKHLVTNGNAKVSAKSDYTIKIDALGLHPATVYFYRFSSGTHFSVTGKTKTLPKGNIEKAKLAVFSCANYPAGFFNAYGLAAKQGDFDAVLHLGDYIYEYGRDGYATEHAEELERLVLPEGEIISLNDYRTRYAQYRTDKDLQALHNTAPFICVWDDHEITNDTYVDGAENHQDDEGDFGQRKLSALQAYFEWMPIRPVVEGNNEIINRTFKFGNLVDLFMLDTRVVGRDKQLSYSDYFDSEGTFDVSGFTADVSHTERTLLGKTQRSWLLDELASSNGAWSVLGQQVLMGRMLLPAAIVTQQLSREQYAEYAQLAFIASKIKAKDETVTKAQWAYFSKNKDKLTPKVMALLALPNIPYNLDAWDGYTQERETILQAGVKLKKNLVVLAGDTHNAWANNIRTHEGDIAAVEFATPGVTSPGFEYYLKLSEKDFAPTEAAITQLITDLQYFNAANRGFMTVTFTKEKVTSKWHYVDTVLSKSYKELKSREQTVESMSNSLGIKLV
ncbi:alkaline phosphatase D family protein [Alteromonas sp. 5E99-2]|uniref:alkaline phosphatase D family protein n=1 Tax=Alteromonas sp. 5E99-2 TaxID=2817683 RepID=UPI001A9A181E|nr:alkaline phosphatase D family protein [Alteromonas sp. 5E99-2]MBO1255631.1 alkaline phosphatase D family protein [Alteromonas sp. 5E99-2]